MDYNVKLSITALFSSLFPTSELDKALFWSYPMEMGMTPDLMYGHNVFVPATNPYQYGYAGMRSIVLVLYLLLVFATFVYSI
jgi:hypothetical protein